MSELIKIAKTWLKTPFVAGAALKGHGCDCVGFLEGVFAELGHEVPARAGLDLLQGLECTDFLIATGEPQIGDILLLKGDVIGNEAQDFHTAILVETNMIIHAHWSRGVVQNCFGTWFRNRLHNSYRYLGQENWQL